MDYLMRNWRRSGGPGPGEPIRVLSVEASSPIPDERATWTFDRPISLHANCPQLEAQDPNEFWQLPTSTTQTGPATVECLYSELVDTAVPWRILAQPVRISERFIIPQQGFVT